MSTLVQTGQAHDALGLTALFGLLAAFTLSTLDGGSVQQRVVSVAFLLLAAVVLERAVRAAVDAECA